MIFPKLKYLAVLLPFALASCSGLQKYYGKLEVYMMKEDSKSAEALTLVSKDAYGQKNELLYFLDLGLLCHLSGKYRESNAAFEQAKRIYDENYTKSVSAGAFSLFTNDTVIPYYGQPHEMAYANVFCALNYIMLEMNDEAVVEARQTDNLFKKIKTDYRGKAFYNDDGFVRYFMGLVYENAGYYNDALISYKLALKSYKRGSYTVPVPEDLINSLYTTFYNLGMSAEASNLKEEYPAAKRLGEQSGGELIIVDYNGLSPKKIDNIIELSFYKAWPYFNATRPADDEQAKAEQVRSAVQAGFSDDFIKVAFPKYVRYKNAIAAFGVEELDEKGNAVRTFNPASFTASDIASMLENILEKQNSAVYAKTVARAVGRYVLTKVAVDQVKQKESKNNDTLSILTKSVLNITSSLLEKADKRSWRTLPENINMARLFLPAGQHKINIKYLDNYGRTVSSEQINVNILENKKTFVTVQSFGN